MDIIFSIQIIYDSKYKDNESFIENIIRISSCSFSNVKISIKNTEKEIIPINSSSSNFNFIVNDSLDISELDFSLTYDFSEIFYKLTSTNKISIIGIIDMINCSKTTSYKCYYENMVNGNNLKTPLKLKNIPDDFDYKIAGFSDETQFEIIN